MRCKAKNFRVVEKDSHQFDDGEVTYRVTGSNGEGGLCRLSVPDPTLYESFVPYDVQYDLEIEVRMSGFKTYADILSAVPSK